MADDFGYYSGSDGGSYGGETPRIKDMEEKQNILKERILLIGQNLIETKEGVGEKMTEIKKEIESLKEDVMRMKSFVEIVSGEMAKFARREDLEILTKQAKMFQPLEFVRKSELKKLIKKE